MQVSSWRDFFFDQRTVLLGRCDDYANTWANIRVEAEEVKRSDQANIC